MHIVGRVIKGCVQDNDDFQTFQHNVDHICTELVMYQGLICDSRTVRHIHTPLFPVLPVSPSAVAQSRPPRPLWWRGSDPHMTTPG